MSSAIQVLLCCFVLICTPSPVFPILHWSFWHFRDLLLLYTCWLLTSYLSSGSRYSNRSSSSNINIILLGLLTSSLPSVSSILLFLAWCLYNIAACIINCCLHPRHLFSYSCYLLQHYCWLIQTPSVQEIQKKSFNNTTKYLFLLITFADIDFLGIQNLGEYYYKITSFIYF